MNVERQRASAQRQDVRSARSKAPQAKLSRTLAFFSAATLVVACSDQPVQPPTTGETGVDAAREAIQFLAALMDRYHERFVVYEDVGSAGNHFVSFGKIPSERAAVHVNGSWQTTRHSGATSIRFEFAGTGSDFGGYYMTTGVLPPGATTPIPTFGETAGAGINLSGATELTYWARGEGGGEAIDFFVAGVGRNAQNGTPVAQYPDASPRRPAYGNVVRLTAAWQRYTIDLRGADLSYVQGGFGWTANARDNPQGAVFYVDDIEFVLGPAARQARLDQPRFLLSFVTFPVQPDPFDSDRTDDLDLVLRNLAFSYDNALALLAFLAEGSSESLRRARLIGDAFVRASQRDRSFTDGRIRTAYAAGDIELPPAWMPNGRSRTVPVPGFYSEDLQRFFEVEQGAVDVGNNAWTMIALLALNRRTQDARYLDTAVRIGRFIRSFRNDAGRFLGYQGGVEDAELASVRARPWASAEHNIDIYAAFRAAAELTGDASWSNDALHAREFVAQMWDDTRGCFLAGTLDATTRNSNPGQLPVDVQAWGVLADILVPPATRAAALDCAERNHRTSNSGFQGYDFNEDRDGVWFEGSAHMATAYAVVGDASAAERLRAMLRNAQRTQPFGMDGGIAAAAKDRLTTGFGFEFYRRLHTGATSWLIFAQLARNPYDLR
jgi:hypothetical protein